MYKILIIILITGIVGLGVVLSVQTTLKARSGQPNETGALKSVLNTGDKFGGVFLRIFKRPDVSQFTIITSKGSGDFNIENKKVRDQANIYTKSQYFNNVKFIRRSSELGKDADQEYLALSVREGRNIDITGWTLLNYSNRVGYKIPQGITTNHPIKREPFENILVTSGDVVIVNSGDSPIGKSFRVNKCSGYSQQHLTFYPGIKEKCPSALDILEDSTEVSFSDSRCFEYIRNINRCEDPTDVPTSLSNNCESFIRNNLSETSCIENFETDSNFLLKEYRVFLSKSSTVWSKGRGAIFLLDKQENLVDVFEYTY